MKNRVFLAFTVLILISGISLADSTEAYRQGQLLVRFAGAGYSLDSPDPAVQAVARQQILDSAGGGTVIHLFKRIPGWALVKLPEGQCVESMLPQYSSTPGIILVEPNYKAEFYRIPNDSRFNELWAMRNTGQAGGQPDADIDATEAWDIETGDSDIIVAVIDSGVDYTHPDLNSNMWINLPEFEGDPDVDDDGNGYIDDIYGYDFSGTMEEDPDDADGDPCDVLGHGTHVAGTIGAVGNNARGVTGVCWNVKLMALKIGADDSGTSISFADGAMAIEYAIDMGADVINASWGGDYFSMPLREAIDEARNAGIIFVASAGNGGDDYIGDDIDLMPAYPAAFDLDNIISVLATNNIDDRPVYSNYGLDSVDLGAPGGDSMQGGLGGMILSTIPGNSYGYGEGTSMAAPHVSGACALLLSFDPELDYTEIKNLLINTADPLPALFGRCVSGGRMNLGSAMTQIAIDDDPPTPDPAQWASWGQPKATGLSSIAMEAVKAQDRSAVEYYFECVTNSAFDSGWQSGTLYAATGLAEGTEYTFRVRVRDVVGNTTGWSVQSSATTDSGTDTSSPFPDPPIWNTYPYAFRLTPVWIIMKARTASDESGVEYRFEETSGTGFNSGWQSNSVLNITSGSFVIGGVYEFRFKVRDQSSNWNETAYSSTKSLTLRQGPRTLPVPGHYPTIQDAIDAAGEGDMVVVSPGTYFGTGNTDLRFHKNIPVTVSSIDPNNPAIVASTVINCQGDHRGFIFENDEDLNTVVAGLTIRNGYFEGSKGTPGSSEIPGVPGDPGDPADPCDDIPEIPAIPAAQGGPGGDGEGGGIICLDASPTIYKCVLDECIAQGGDGGDANGGPGGGAAGSGYGGGIYCDSKSDPIIRDCEITACRTRAGFAMDVDLTVGNSFGGGIYIEHGSEALIKGCSIMGCTASDDNSGIAQGGGIYHALAIDPVSIIDTTVTANKAGERNRSVNNGGGICFASAGNGAILKNCEITFNSAVGGNGGGIYYPEGHTLSIEGGSLIYGNQSPYRGGGIFAGDITHTDSATVNISDSSVSYNSALFGGGIYMDETHFSLTDSEVGNNTASEGAGINGAFCDVSILSSTVSNNSAQSGASIGGGIALWNSTAQIVDCVIQGNDAIGTSGIGGALYFNGFDSSPKSLVNCLIRDNEASREGAGLFCHLGAWAEVTNCTIADNRVVDDIGGGGGISCAEFASIVQLENSIVYNNNAPAGPQIAVGRVTGSAFDPYAIVTVDYSDVQGGEDDVFEELPYAMVLFGTGNWDEENPFISIGGGELGYFLRHVATGQANTSNLVDNGLGNASGLISQVGFDLTTRIDGVVDTGTVDIGYHYTAEEVVLPYYHLTIRVEHHPDYDADGILKAEAAGYEPFFARNEPNTMLVAGGVEVELTAIADSGFNVSQWIGADDVPNTGDPCNFVTMDSDKEVVVSFGPDGAFYLFTDVSTDNGHIDYINGDEQRVEHPGRTLHEPNEVVRLFAVPDNTTLVPHWSGTDDDQTVGLENSVTMNENRNVVVEFITPRTLHVPGEYTNIQTAIDDAENGDIIIIAPGTYVRGGGGRSMRYVINGKQITLTGSDPEDPCTVASTVLQTGIVVLNVGRTCRIQGLTFDGIVYSDLGGYDGGTEENALPDGENGFPLAGAALRLHNYYFQGRHMGPFGTPIQVFPPDPQPGSSPDVRNCVFNGCGVIGSDGGAGAVVDDAPGDGGWGGWSHGGAVSLGADSNPRFTNCQFINCFARGGDGGNGTEEPDGRGGLWDQTDYPDIPPFRIWEFGPYEEFFKYSGFGGAVFVDANSSPEFIDCNFVNCQAYGGASGLGGGFSWPPVHWRVNRFGGAVYCADDSTANFTRCRFIGNTADVDGPVEWDWASFHSEAQEEVESDDDFLSYGGAVAFEDSANLTFRKCYFNDNTATVGGAVHWTWSDPRFDDCNFVGNTAFHGGGILCVGGSGLINDCQFTGNMATISQGQGGAVASLGANIDILNSQIIGNQAQGSGGGLYISSKDIRGDEITSWNTVNVRNCLIAENIAGSTGAGISSNWHSFVDIELCTIANNSILQGGYGGGLYSSNGNYAIVTNSILWENVAANGRQIAIRPSANPAGVAVSYTDIRGGITYTQPPDTGGNIWVDQDCLFETGPGNIGADIDDDPLFVSGVLGDYYLSQTATPDPGQNEDSPCVDAGSGSASSLDMADRTTRTDLIPDRGPVDMGYHYRRDMLSAMCAVCDLVFDGIIDTADVDAYTDEWLRDGCSDDNGWCNGADFNYDGTVDLIDDAIIGLCWLVEDKQPPVPNPSQWRILPYSNSMSSVFMGAEQSYDLWGVEVQYYFESSDANHDSGWQNDLDYESQGLVAGRQYSYRVKARDQWGNETKFSGFGTAVVNEDSTAPTPNPMTWAVLPAPVSNTEITMIASMATDESGVEYGFRRLGGPTVWQNEPVFVDMGLNPLTEYTYQTAARDKSDNQNATEWSVTASATTADTPALPDLEPPITGLYANIYKAAFSPTDFPEQPAPGGLNPVEVYLADGYHHRMIAAAATDDTPPVQYKFTCLDDSRFSSGWQEDPYYDVLVSSLTSKSSWRWQVRTRDSAEPTPNLGGLSDYWNCQGDFVTYP